MAFEKQSQHISGLLAELQEKETALLSQGEELQCYKQELDALKAQKDGEKKERREEVTVKEVQDGEQKEETRDERSVEISGLQPTQEKERVILTTNSLADSDSNAQTDAGQPEIPNHDATCVMGETEGGQDGGTADVVAELLALRLENQLMKQRIEGLTVSDISAPALHTDSENQEDPAKQSQSTGNAALSCSVEQRSPSVPKDITAEARQSLLQNVKRSEDEGGDLERGDGRTVRAEEELEAVCQLQIDRLQQQVATVYYLFIS